MKKAIIIICLVTMSMNFSDAIADSLWAKKGKNITSPYIDDKASKVGDILTIYISEVTEIETKVKRKLEKSTSRNAGWDGKLGIKHSLIPVNLNLPSFNIGEGATSNKTLDGKSENKDEREVTDKITVIVEDVQPNGNLVIIGKIQRSIGGDKQIIKVSGIVRPSDISYGNTVKSERIANFNLFIENEGVSDTYTKVGWVGKILDFIWPF